MASASASVVPPLIPLQRRRIRGISGVSSTESASPTDFPGPTVFDTDVDRQADSTVKQEEADLQEDLALADSLNTALPGRHEDDEEVAATQQDGEEDAVDEGEEEEEMEEEEEEVATRQAQVAPPPQEGVVEQGEVIAACLRSQARARGQVYKGAPAIAAAAIACVTSLISFSPRHARQCRYALHTPFPLPSGLEDSGTLSDSLRSCRGLLVLSSGPLLSLLQEGPMRLIGFAWRSVRRMLPLPSPTCHRDSVRQHLPFPRAASLHVFAIAQVRASRSDPEPGSMGHPVRELSAHGVTGVYEWERPLIQAPKGGNHLDWLLSIESQWVATPLDLALLDLPLRVVRGYGLFILVPHSEWRGGKPLLRPFRSGFKNFRNTFYPTARLC